MKRVLVLGGVQTTVATLESAADGVVEVVRANHGGYVCLCNVHLLMTARRDESVRGALNGAALAFADGVPVAWLQRREGCTWAERVAGTELFHEVLGSESARGLRHVFFGGNLEKLDSMIAVVSRKYPAVDIAGAISPPLGAVGELGGAWVDEINSCRPDIVWCALGAPKQELWMSRFAAEISPAVAVGVGAAFDFVTGSKPRAPQWMRTGGLEWLHRLANEPRRLGHRYATTNASFAYALAAERVSQFRVGGDRLSIRRADDVREDGQNVGYERARQP